MEQTLYSKNDQNEIKHIRCEGFGIQGGMNFSIAEVMTPDTGLVASLTDGSMEHVTSEIHDEHPIR